MRASQTVTKDAQGKLDRLQGAPHQEPDRARLVDHKAEDGRTVAANRKGHATIGAPAASPWLFPCGQPGRHISTGQLTQRLNRLGICPNQARSTAFFQPAAEILARTLGIHTDVAVTWQRLPADDWANYAAEVASRKRPRARSRYSSTRDRHCWREAER